MEFLDLSFANKQDFDYSILQYATNLTTLRIALNGDSSFLRNLNKLQYLYITNIKTNDYQEIGNCSNLVYLDIMINWYAGDKLSDYSFLSQLKKIKILNLCGNAAYIDNFSSIANNENLEYLYIGNPFIYTSNRAVIDGELIKEMKSLKTLIMINATFKDHSVLDNVDWIDISEDDYDKTEALKCTFGFLESNLMDTSLSS